MTTPSHALWVDLETTGTDERTGHVLEVGCVLTPLAAPWPTLSTYRLAVLPSDPSWREQMAPVVRRMHTDNGLLDELAEPREALDREQVDKMLRAWRRAVCREFGVEDPLALAGSGVGHFDSRWLRLHFPLFTRGLTFWTLDVGVLRRAFVYAGRADVVEGRPDQPEEKRHRGLADALDHLAEWRWYAAHLGALGGPS